MSKTHKYIWSNSLISDTQCRSLINSTAVNITQSKKWLTDNKENIPLLALSNTAYYRQQQNYHIMTNGHIRFIKFQIINTIFSVAVNCRVHFLRKYSISSIKLISNTPVKVFVWHYWHILHWSKPILYLLITFAIINVLFSLDQRKCSVIINVIYSRKQHEHSASNPAHFGHMIVVTWSGVFKFCRRRVDATEVALFFFLAQRKWHLGKIVSWLAQVTFKGSGFEETAVIMLLTSLSCCRQ